TGAVAIRRHARKPPNFSQQFDPSGQCRRRRRSRHRHPKRCRHVALLGLRREQRRRDGSGGVSCFQSLPQHDGAVAGGGLFAGALRALLMKAITFASLEEAQAFQAKVDAAYIASEPAPINVGGGRHGVSITTGFSKPKEHPTIKGMFACCVDGLDPKILPANEKVEVEAAVSLTADWTPIAVAPADAQLDLVV